MTQILYITATSAVVATVVGFLLNALQMRIAERRSARLEALQAAVSLEGFAISCADAISDHDTAVESEGHAGRLFGPLPELPTLGISVGLLRPRRATVANRLAVFPQEVQQSKQAANFWWDVVGDMDAARNAAKYEAAHLGLSSLGLARDLRSAFGLPTRSLVFGKWDVAASLLNVAENDPRRE